jgi:pyruvate/2-oxoglutarate dehydrogenase complex dihydrolipoamide acyltransferase (E2) component
LKAQIDKLDPASKKQLLTTLQKGGQAAAPEAPAAAPEAPAAAPEAPAAAPAAEEPGYDPQTGVANPAMMAQNSAAGKAAAPHGFNPQTGQPNPPPAGQAPAPAADKLSTKDQNALKARLKAKQGTAAKTQSGFNQYVQGGGGSTMAGADAQGNPIFKQNVQRESVEFYSKFLGQML